MSSEKNFTEVDKLIDACMEQELKAFLKAYGRKDTSFITEFLSAFPNPDISDDVYRKQLKALLQKVSDRDGFIDWNAVRRMDADLNQLINLAEKHQINQDWKAVVAICTALAEELIDVLNYTDDSNGIIGGTIDTAFDILSELVSCNTQFARQYLWDFFVRNYEQKIFEGWDWHLTILKLLLELADSEDQINQVRRFLTEKAGSEYDRENRELLNYQFILSTGDMKEADRFAREHSSNSYLREKIIENAIAYEDYTTAIQMAEDGIKKDEKNKPGLAKQWQDILLSIYLLKKDTEKVIALSRMLFIDGFMRGRDYYSLLKEQVDNDEWKNFVESMVYELSQSKRRSIDRIADIYIRENDLDKLLKLITSTTGLQALGVYDRYLAKKYPSELALLYARELPDFAASNASRRDYQETCKIIGRIQQLGEKALATQLIENLKATYPQRRAMVEELNRI